MVVNNLVDLKLDVLDLRQFCHCIMLLCCTGLVGEHKCCVRFQIWQGVDMLVCGSGWMGSCIVLGA